MFDLSSVSDQNRNLHKNSVDICFFLIWYSYTRLDINIYISVSLPKMLINDEHSCRFMLRIHIYTYCSLHATIIQYATVSELELKVRDIVFNSVCCSSKARSVCMCMCVFVILKKHTIPNGWIFRSKKL